MPSYKCTELGASQIPEFLLTSSKYYIYTIRMARHIQSGVMLRQGGSEEGAKTTPRRVIFFF